MVELGHITFALSIEMLAGVTLALLLKTHMQVVELADINVALLMELLVGVTFVLLLKATSEE